VYALEFIENNAGKAFKIVFGHTPWIIT
jgi:hypothetical protein